MEKFIDTPLDFRIHTKGGSIMVLIHNYIYAENFLHINLFNSNPGESQKSIAFCYFCQSKIL